MSPDSTILGIIIWGNVGSSLEVFVSGVVPQLKSLSVPLTDLKTLEGNPRLGDVEAVMRSLEKFGQRKPIVARESTGEVIAGNHTFMAAGRLGWDEIAVVWVDDDDATAKAFALADNRTSELGSYDNELLAAMIAEVMADDEELLAAASYSEADLTALLEETLGDTADEFKPFDGTYDGFSGDGEKTMPMNDGESTAGTWVQLRISDVKVHILATVWVDYYDKLLREAGGDGAKAKHILATRMGFEEGDYDARKNAN